MTSIGLLRSLSPLRNPNKVNPLEQAQALLGEHYENYIVAVVHPKEKELEFAYDNPYACVGILASLNEHMDDLKGTEMLDWVTEDDEDDYEDL